MRATEAATHASQAATPCILGCNPRTTISGRSARPNPSPERTPNVCRPVGEGGPREDGGLGGGSELPVFAVVSAGTLMVRSRW